MPLTCDDVEFHRVSLFRKQQVIALRVLKIASTSRSEAIHLKDPWYGAVNGLRSAVGAYRGEAGLKCFLAAIAIVALIILFSDRERLGPVIL